MTRLNRTLNAVLIFTALIGVLAVQAQADFFELPGVVPPSGCRVGGVVSTEQWTSTGFSNVRTANPNDEIVAGAWVVANEFVPDTSIVLAPNCVLGGLGVRGDNLGLNLMAIRLTPTIASAAEADIREVKLVWDVNANGLWDPLLDLVIQTKPGDMLDTQDGAVFFNGPQSPLAIFSMTVTPFLCQVGMQDAAPALGIGPVGGTNSRGTPLADGCWIGLLAIAVIGDNPTTGSQFGLSLEALAGDIPGTTGAQSFTFSSGFSSSRNPQASNVRLHMVGGTPSSHTPLEHISNSSGNPESAVRALTFTGGQAGEGLLTRFRAQEINPGTREAIAMVVGICDGAELANTIASILPAIAGAPPTIAGGLNSLPCIPSNGSDGFATGVNGATLIFRGPLARYMSTVRMYWDECTEAGVSADTCEVLSPILPPTTASATGGGDGFLFQAGELVEQVVPVFNEQTGEAFAQFGGRQEQILFTGTGNPLAHGSDPICRTAPPCTPVAVPDAGTTPAIVIWTVDIDQNAPGGIVDVLLGLQSFDDTAINLASGGGNPCSVFTATAPTIPVAPNNPGPGTEGSCASNFLNIGPELYSFTVNGPEHPSTPNNLAAFDTNNSCFIDDPEFFTSIDGWVDTQIGDDLFFDVVDVWVGQENICAASTTGVSALSLDGVSLENAFGTTTFSVSGQGISSIHVEIFSMSGEAVFSSESVGTSLSWNQMTTSGAPVANGTYLYVVTALGADGTSEASEVQKLAIIR